MNSSIPDAVSVEDIKRETELDPVLQKIISVIQSGRLRELHKDPELKPCKLPPRIEKWVLFLQS